MHRLLVETDQIDAASPRLSPEARRHLRVLRLKNGEIVELFDGKGRFRAFSYRGDGGLSPTEEARFLPQPSAALTLFACVTKGSRWDWTVEKATELGVSRIVPVLSEHTIVRLLPSEYETKRLRWQRVAEDAARQSDAKWLPEIHAPVAFADALPLVRETTCFVGALANPRPKTIGEVLSHLSAFPPFHFSTFIGPEGDFTPDELAALLEVATPVSLGQTILRAETAAIYAVSVIKAFLEGVAP